MTMLIDELPTYFTEEHGQPFEKDRELSMRDFHRMMKKLHWDETLNYQDLMTALLQKDSQRLKKSLNKYVESECRKYNDAGIFIRIPITVQELGSVEYIISYRIFTELSVREIEKEK